MGRSDTVHKRQAVHARSKEAVNDITTTLQMQPRHYRD